MSKYHNRVVHREGQRFDSVAEYEHYLVLREREGRGEISELDVHPRYVLQEGFRANGKTYRAITYEADFSYLEDGKHVVVDVKGMVTAVFALKEKLFRFRYPQIEFRVVKVKRR